MFKQNCLASAKITLSFVKTQIVLSSEKIIQSFLVASNVIRLIGNNLLTNFLGGYNSNCSEKSVYSFLLKLYSIT